MKSATTFALGVALLLAIACSVEAYDFFYFVQQWPGSYCDTSSGCCYPTSGKPQSDFAIYGLWPYYANGTYPSNCDSSNAFNATKIQDIQSSLQTNWPSLNCPSSNSSSLWASEWATHGTCSETVLDEHTYFQDALSFKNQTFLLQCLKSKAITPNGGLYMLDSITNAITSCLGHVPGIGCNKDSSGRYQLYLVYLCINQSGTLLMDCPVYPSSGCGSSTSVYFPSF
ncbi:hypothetical protein LUZ61_008657 [Rhynchospora tenuis]|uniref:Uncharacterized protein n=1 Tax=Rhynchospora tenuis TaxID=198213 RepID=A0AAD6EXN7_9POAL|nr:hypothetical protein LUZ61_008657 [Rhynchospora tenuis]